MVCLLSALVSAVFLLLDDQPLVSSYQAISPETLRRAKNTVKYSRQQFVNNSRGLVISIDQVSELLSLLSHLIPRLSTRLDKQNDQLLYAFTLRIPDNPVGRFVNVSIRFVDPQDLTSGTFSAGSISVSNKIGLKILALSLPLWLDQQSVEPVRRLIKKSRFNERLIFLEFTDGIDRQVLLEDIFGQIMQHQGKLLSDAEIKNIAFYYGLLAQLANNNDKAVFSVFDFIQPLLMAASVRSYADPAAAARQNESALIALGLLLGDRQLVRALQNVVNIPTGSRKKINVKLAGRKDLKLHFLYSSIIQILTNRGISLSLGEIKEISDMDRGGSGFSFVDIAADRVGLHFASIAIDPAGGALLLQNQLKTARSEASFFPDISLLAENLTQREFAQAYQNTESAAYFLVIDEIDRRIHALPLYSAYRQLQQNN
ncbi:MAG: hypothetical protein ISR73_07175 [Gammaproteobacteria bacterium]|nr:hypothetical protein [Gammaproteobacteria bacterium]